MDIWNGYHDCGHFPVLDYKGRVADDLSGVLQGLIPYKDEPDSKLEDKKQSEQCRQAMEEFNEMKEVSAAGPWRCVVNVFDL